MSERPTPIVDSCEFTIPIAGKVIVSKTARRLERERDEAREALEYIAHSGLSARFLEDFAREFLRRKETAK